MSGKSFPDEPALWVTNTVLDGVRPWPGIDSRVFAVNEDRHIAVVWTPPLATPPCITRGTVYERVPGASIPVKDAARLADLYRRGDEAHRTARTFATRAARALIEQLDTSLDDANTAGFVLAVRATGYGDLDLSRYLFSESFSSAVETAMNSLPTGQPAVLGTDSWPEWAQDSIAWRRDPQISHGHRWLMRTTWDGAIAIRWTMQTDAVATRSLVATPITRAWMLALHLIRELGAVRTTASVGPGATA
jgi:hypothetical protein